MVERKIVPVLVIASLLGGCTLAPKYSRPAAPVSDTFAAEKPEDEEGKVAASDIGWRDVFGDPRLQALVELALENNRDLRVAALNVQRFQALYRIQRAPLFPNASVNGAANFQGQTGTPPDGLTQPPQIYTLNLNVTSWELDFFGRIRSLSEASLQQYFSTEEAHRSAHLAVVSQVAIAHFDERALAEQLVLARQTLQLVEESFRVTRRSFELGTASELDLKTAETQVETSRFNLAFYEQQHGQAVNALVFLIGRPLPEDLPASMPLQDAKIAADIPAGLPSDLLTRRPDILSAEHQLLAANASIGAARAAFFPSITLTGAAGFESVDLGQLFTGGLVWNFLPRINLPIFRAGALKASLDAAEISKSIEIATYERAIQAAFREVSDALVARESIQKQLEAASARVASEERRYHLANLRYRAGIERYVTLLTAQRDLYLAQQQLINAQFARLSNITSLYRALGGGWNEYTQTAAGDAAQPGEQGG